MILYLTGPPGAGKSSAGKALAEKTGRRFFDIDQIIEDRSGKSIADIFSQDGEEFFRGLEREILRECSAHGDAIIATGGGVVTDRSNREFMRKNGIIMLLMASPETLAKRIGQDNTRPLLEGDLKKSIKKVLFERAAAYCYADGILNTTALTLNETVEYLRNLDNDKYFETRLLK